MATALDRRIEFEGAGVVDRDEERLQEARHVEVHASPAVVLDELLRVLPSRMQLGALRDARLRLLQPLEIVVSQEADQIVAEAVELNEFGWGANLSEAIADLQRAIAELYFQLEADRDRLGSGLRAVWSTLGVKMRRA